MSAPSMKDRPYDFRRGTGSTLLIACGALGREVIDLIEMNNWRHLDVAAIPAKLHHQPELIPDAVREKIRAGKETHDKIYVLYGDCGTGGALDALLEEEGVERIPGPHCFSFFAGNDAFEAAADDEIATFYLSDYFCRHFDTFVWKALGLDRREDMKDFVFANYRHLIYLAQTEDTDLEARAREIADRLGLTYEYRFCGYGDLAPAMQSLGPAAAAS